MNFCHKFLKNQRKNIDLSFITSQLHNCISGGVNRNKIIYDDVLVVFGYLELNLTQLSIVFLYEFVDSFLSVEGEQ